MKPFVLVVIASIGTIATAGCNRSKQADSTGTAVNGNKLVNPKITMVRGCLTGSGDRFVLTNLENAASPANGGANQPAAEPVAPTESYRLVGQDDQLKNLVGQRVQVTGDSTPEQVVDMVSATPSNPPAGNAVGTAGNEGKVSTASRARIEIHDLR